MIYYLNSQRKPTLDMPLNSCMNNRKTCLCILCIFNLFKSIILMVFKRTQKQLDKNEKRINTSQRAQIMIQLMIIRLCVISGNFWIWIQYFWQTPYSGSTALLCDYHLNLKWISISGLLLNHYWFNKSRHLITYVPSISLPLNVYDQATIHSYLCKHTHHPTLEHLCGSLQRVLMWNILHKSENNSLC